ncbi:MAG: AarF/UbiB family protein [Deltaproteobacteria bacterium]|nr:AarF/UbiB family protein [Deltaproteobacteria bacterium]
MALCLSLGGLLEAQNYERLTNIIDELVERYVQGDERLIKMIKEILPILFQPSDPFIRLEFLTGMLDTVARKEELASKTDVSEIASSLLASMGPVGVKIAQILGENPLVRENFPELFRALEQHKRNAKIDLVTVFKCLSRIKLPEGARIKIIGNASIKAVILVEELSDNGSGNKYVVKVARPGFQPNRWLRYLDELTQTLNKRLSSKTDYRIPYSLGKTLVQFILEELDLNREAEGFQKLRQGFASDVIIPRVIKAEHDFMEEEYCPSVERVELSRPQKFRLLLHLVQGLAGKPVHFDLHRGNVGQTKFCELIIYDSGTVISLSVNSRRELWELLLAVLSKRYFVRFLDRRKQYLGQDRYKTYSHRNLQSHYPSERLRLALDVIFESQLKGYELSNETLRALFGLSKSGWLFEGINARDMFNEIISTIRIQAIQKFWEKIGSRNTQ